MKKENDGKKLERYLNRYSIRSFFSDDSLPFELYSFSPREVINNLMDPSEYLMFFVSGRVSIFHIRDDGTVFTVYEMDEFSVLGDVEFGAKGVSPLLVEAVVKSYVVVLPLRNRRKKLMQDPVFLWKMLESVSKKFTSFSDMVYSPGSLRDKVLYHFRYTEKDHMIRSVVRTCSALQCSKRQLLRILKALCEEGVLEKTGKGTYRLMQCDSIDT